MCLSVSALCPTLQPELLLESPGWLPIHHLSFTMLVTLFKYESEPLTSLPKNSENSRWLPDAQSFKSTQLGKQVFSSCSPFFLGAINLHVLEASPPHFW